MRKGGRREGAGRLSTWASGAGREDTKPVRIPKNLIKPIVEIAHWLDAGEISIDEIRLLIQCKGEVN